MRSLTILRPGYGNTTFKGKSKKDVLDQLKIKLVNISDIDTHGVKFVLYRGKSYTIMHGMREQKPFIGWIVRYREKTDGDDIVRDTEHFVDRIDAVYHFLILCDQKGDHWD